MGLFSNSDNQSKRNHRPSKGSNGRESLREAEHGVLRSELDEPEHLPEPFERLIESSSFQRHRFEKGEITKHQLGSELQALRATEADGTEWTLGATSGRWYKRPLGGTWVPAMPPAASEGSFQGKPGTDFTDEAASAMFGNAPSVGDSVNRGDPFGESDTGFGTAFDVAASITTTDPVAPWPEVTGNASRTEPVVYSAPAPLIDIFGAWEDTWESVDRSEADAAKTANAFAANNTATPLAASLVADTTGFGNDIFSAFGSPAPVGSSLESPDVRPKSVSQSEHTDGAGWAAWGLATPSDT